MLGGPDIITFLLLALGGALAVGNLAALINPEGPRRRPPPPPGAPGDPAEPAKPQLWRSLAMVAVGMVIVIWAAASLIGG